MIELSASLEGDKELHRTLNIIPKNLDNFEEPLFRIGIEMLSAFDSNYDSRGSLFKAKWKPRKDKKSHPLLEKTGKMRRSFTSKLGNNYVELYNTAEYFKYHQSNAPRKKLPRRVMMKIDEIRKVFIVKAFQEHIRSSIKKAK